MCHYPIPFYKHDFDEKTYMFYGHVHNTLENQNIERLRNILKLENPSHQRNFINVGCMMPWMNYYPRTFKQILDGFNKYMEENNARFN